MKLEFASRSRIGPQVAARMQIMTLPLLMLGWAMAAAILP